MQDITINPLDPHEYTYEEMFNHGKAAEESGRKDIAEMWYAAARRDKNAGVALGRIYLYGEEGIEQNLIIAATLFRTDLEGEDGDDKEGKDYLRYMYKKHRMPFSSYSFETYFNDAVKFDDGTGYGFGRDQGFDYEFDEPIVQNYIQQNIDKITDKAEKKELAIKLTILERKLQLLNIWLDNSLYEQNKIFDAMMGAPNSYLDFEFHYILTHARNRLTSEQQFQLCKAHFEISSLNPTYAIKRLIIEVLEFNIKNYIHEIVDPEELKVTYEILYFYNKEIEGDTPKTQKFRALFEDALNKDLPPIEQDDKESLQKKQKANDEPSNAEKLNHFGLLGSNNTQNNDSIASVIMDEVTSPNHDERDQRNNSPH